MITLISHNVKSQNSIYQPLVDNLNLLFGKEIKLEIINSLNYDFPRFILVNNQKRWIFGFNKFGPAKFLYDIFYVIFGLLKFNKNRIVIALNPLNTFSVLLYRYFSFKKVQIVYYIPDYSPNRFPNKYLNTVYHWIENFATKNSDAIVCVSVRVYEMKKHLNKNSFLIKNYPPSTILNLEINKMVKKYDLVLAGFLEDYYQFEVIKKLIEKFDLSLLVIGGGSRLGEIKDFFIKNKKVIFTGHLEKKEVFNYLRECNIGLALYNNKNEYNQFGDSVKCRDYIAAGLPILTTNNHSTAREINENKLGKVIENLDIDTLEKEYLEIAKNLKEISYNCINYFNKDGDIREKWESVFAVNQKKSNF